MARLERLDEDRAILGREPAAKNQRAVLVPVPVEIGALLRGGGFFGRHPPVGPHGSFELGGGQLQREAQEILLGLWLGDPGQRPDLGVGELPGRESGANRRELAQPARDPERAPWPFEASARSARRATARSCTRPACRADRPPPPVRASGTCRRRRAPRERPAPRQARGTRARRPLGFLHRQRTRWQTSQRTGRHPRRLAPVWTDRHSPKLYSFRSRKQDTPGGQ